MARSFSRTIICHFSTCCVSVIILPVRFKFLYEIIAIKWAATCQNQQIDCVPSEDSDQPWYPPSLIRVFAVRIKKAWVLSYPLSAQRRLWSDCADAQADLSLRWAHRHFVSFVMSRLKWRSLSPTIIMKMWKILMMLQRNYEVKIWWFCLLRVAPGWEHSGAPVHTRTHKLSGRDPGRAAAEMYWIQWSLSLPSRVLYQ